MTEVYANVIKTGSCTLVAICDRELLGRSLSDGRVAFVVRREFYGGELMRIEEAMELAKGATVLNIVGKVAVAAAIKRGLVHPNAVLRVARVPHAQAVRPQEL